MNIFYLSLVLFASVIITGCTLTSAPKVMLCEDVTHGPLDHTLIKTVFFEPIHDYLPYGQDKNIISTLEHVFFFAFDSSEPITQSYSSIEQHAEYLATNKDKVVLIEGGADESGLDDYNLALGLKRAKSIAALLIDAGANEDQLIIHSIGIERPLNKDSSPRNRRVTIVY